MEPVAIKQVVKNRQVISLDKAGFRVAWHPSEKRLAVLDGSLNLVEFDATTGHIIHVLPTLVRGALNGGIAYSPDGKYLIGGNGVISVFDAGSGQKVKEILGPYDGDPHGAQGLDTLTISPDSRLVAVRYSQYKHTIRHNISVFEIETGRLVFSLPDVGDKVHASSFSGNLVFTPDGNSLLSPRYEVLTDSERKRTGVEFHYTVYLEVLDVRTGKVTRIIPAIHVQRITAQAVSADGKLIATGTNTLSKESNLNETTGGWDYINNQDPIRIWSAETGKIHKELGPLRGAVRALSFSPDGSLLASCQTDLTNKETLWLWDVASGQLIERVQTPNSAHEFFDCAFSPSGRRVAFPVNRQLYLFDIAQ